MVFGLRRNRTYTTDVFAEQLARDNIPTVVQKYVSRLVLEIMQRHNEYDIGRETLREIKNWEYRYYLTEQEAVRWYQESPQDFEQVFRSMYDDTGVPLDELSEHIIAWSRGARMAEVVITHTIASTIDSLRRHRRYKR